MFKQTYDFNTRYNQCYNIIQKYPDRIPIILEHKPSSQSYTQNNTEQYINLKKTYLVPKHVTIGQFVYIIKKKLDMRTDESLFFSIHDTLPEITATLHEIYEQYKDNDGYLYILYFTKNNMSHNYCNIS